MTLARRLGTGDAVLLGLGAMVGAGVFTVFPLAAAQAGSWLLAALALAAFVALCNATSSAQLAAVYPRAGGTYVYGRERLGPWWGFVAGWSFVIGKTASCAAMALTFAAYAVPGSTGGQRAVGVAAVAGLTALNYRGITRTAGATRVIVTVSLTILATVVVGIALGGGADLGRIADGGSVAGVLPAAGLLFFAFAGYARIATLGEEVRDPARTIPRAVVIALGVAVLVYLGVAVALLAALGPDRLAGAQAPLALALDSAGAGGLAPLARIGAVAASLGALLALIAGVSRTTLAMAREADLPRWLAAVHPRYRVPHHADLAAGTVVGVVVLIGEIREVIGFSSVGVLLYYAVANLAALTQPAADRRYPRILAVLGLVGCLGLVAFLPPAALLGALVVLGVGLLGRALRGRTRAG